MNKKETPLVSVTIPCYNHAEYIGEAVESVLDQTYPNIELIICDNGSTDNSWDAISKYKKYITHMFRLEKNSSASCEEGFKRRISGKYRAVLCSDDYWRPEKLERQIDVLESSPGIKACFTWMAMKDEESGRIFDNSPFVGVKNRSRAEWMRTLLLGGNCVAFPSVVLQSDFGKCALQTRGYRYVPDVMFWLNSLFYGNIHVVQETLGWLRWHPSGKNHNESAANLEHDICECNERADLMRWTIENMPDDLFLETFSKELSELDLLGSQEVECAKFFVLKKLSENDIDLYPASLQYFYDHYHGSSSTNGFSVTMEKRYGFSIVDFSDWSSKHCYKLFQAENEQLSRMVRRSEKKSEIFENYLNQISSDEDRAMLQKELYSSLDAERKKAVDDIYSMLKKIYSQFIKLSDEEIETNYEQLILLLQRIARLIEVSYEDFEYIGVSEICCETWSLFKELLIASSEEKIDFSVAVVPYIESIITGLSKIYDA